MGICRDCTNGIDHCHGVLVEHADGMAACDECATPDPARHELRCACTDPCCGSRPMRHAA